MDAAGHREQFERTVALLDRWKPTFEPPLSVQSAARLHLENELRDGAGRPVSVEPRPESDACDLLVDGSVGVLVYREFSVSDARQLRLLAGVTDLPYDSLVVYGYDIPENHLDSWRVIESKFTASSLGVREITFVRFADVGPDAEVSHGVTSTIDHYAESIVGLVTLVCAVGIFTAAGVDFGVLHTVVSALTAILTVLVNVSLFALLRDVPAH